MNQTLKIQLVQIQISWLLVFCVFNKALNSDSLLSLPHSPHWYQQRVKRRHAAHSPQHTVIILWKSIWCSGNVHMPFHYTDSAPLHHITEEEGHRVCLRVLFLIHWSGVSLCVSGRYSSHPHSLTWTSETVELVWQLMLTNQNPSIIGLLPDWW